MWATWSRPPGRSHQPHGPPYPAGDSRTTEPLSIGPVGRRDPQGRERGADHHEYTLHLKWNGWSQQGFVRLGAQNGQKVAIFDLFSDPPVVTVPFDWSFGHVYLLLTYRLGADTWGAWVFDQSTTVWTFIGQHEAPPGSGGLDAASSTTVYFDPSLAPTPGADWSACATFPRLDAYVYPVIGWRGATTTVAGNPATIVYRGDCPITTSTEYGWRHYRWVPPPHRPPDANA